MKLIINPVLTYKQLKPLWPGNEEFSEAYTTNVLSRSLFYVGVYLEIELIGFANVAWDGGIHAFIVDLCVAPNFRRQKIAQTILIQTAAEARRIGLKWLHVDFDSSLENLYRGAGFSHTSAGLIRL